jgi:hypothetical protein
MIRHLCDSLSTCTLRGHKILLRHAAVLCARIKLLNFLPKIGFQAHEVNLKSYVINHRAHPLTVS